MARVLRSLAMVSLVLAAWAGPIVGQRSHIGPHAGYDFDRNVGLVGGQLSLPLSRAVELYPSVDVYFVSAGSLLGLNGDLKFRLNPGAHLQYYAGGGLSVLRASSGGTSATDTGWDLFGGLESRLGYTHPYLEGRVLNHDRSTFQINVGLNLTLF